MLAPFLSHAVPGAPVSVSAIEEEEDMSFLPEQWERASVAASLTDDVVEAAVSSLFDTIKMDFAGSIVSLVTQLSDVVTAGTLTVSVTKNGSAVFSGAHTSGANSSGGVFTQDEAVDEFAAGDLIGIKITTTADYEPATLDLRCLIGVKYS
jgi:hypothetical protein